NYALSLAAGEYVIFLDADEYFSPALTEADREKILAVFAETKADVLGIRRIEMEKEDGFAYEVLTLERIFRKAAIHYENKIHETARLADGTIPNWVLAPGYNLIHTGYSRDLIEQKLSRNLKILEEEQKRLQDPLKLYMNAMYLMRESFFLDDYDQAAAWCLYLFARHRHYQEAYKNSPGGYLRHFYNSVHVVESRRYKFNRKEVYNKLFEACKELFHGTRDTLLVELHYQLRFDYREDRFLRELAEVEQALLTELPPEIPDRRLIEAKIFEQAAEAAHLRGDRDKSCRYAFRALECNPLLDGRGLLLLLHSLIGCSLKDIELYLKSLALPGRTDIAGTVLRILHEKDACKELIENAAPPDVFWAENKTDALIRVEKFFASMRYRELADDPEAHLAAAQDYRCAYYVAYAQLMQEEYNRAYALLLPHLKRGMNKQALLSLLLVTAEKAPEPLAAEARQLYEEFLAILNETVDLSDIINTGVVYGAEPEKEQRLLQELTLKVFWAEYEKDKKRPVTELLLHMHQKAAAVLEQNGCVLMAAASYRLLLAKGQDTAQNSRNLERLCRAQGNKELAEQALVIPELVK
ncbi:MAG: hypothetical protein LBR56_09375, partial [Sporomusaceae bacterium]|nr:hypothetical protein [Sporomusaceae bacterium]